MATTLKVTPDSSWLAAGESLDLTQYVPKIETVLIDPSATGYVWQYDRTNKKLLAFEAGADGRHWMLWLTLQTFHPLSYTSRSRGLVLEVRPQGVNQYGTNESPRN